MCVVPGKKFFINFKSEFEYKINVQWEINYESDIIEFAYNIQYPSEEPNMNLFKIL